MPERLPLAGFLAGAAAWPRSLRSRPEPVHRLVPGPARRL